MRCFGEDSQGWHESRRKGGWIKILREKLSVEMVTRGSAGSWTLPRRLQPRVDETVIEFGEEENRDDEDDYPDNIIPLLA